MQVRWQGSLPPDIESPLSHGEAASVAFANIPSPAQAIGHRPREAHDDQALCLPPLYPFDDSSFLPTILGFLIIFLFIFF